MSDSIIQLLKRASRPFKKFTFELNGEPFIFYTRSLSSLEADRIGRVFGEEFEKIATEMDSGSIDTAMIRRNLARQSKEKLARLIVNADRADFLAEASSELDDKPFNNPQVQELANEKAEEMFEHLKSEDEENVLEQALERRAFIVASLKATDMQNLHFLYYALYKEPDVRAFENPDEIGEALDRPAIGKLINAIYEALRGAEKTDPLATPPQKPSVRRSRSPKPSAEE